MFCPEMRTILLSAIRVRPAGVQGQGIVRHGGVLSLQIRGFQLLGDAVTVRDPASI